MEKHFFCDSTPTKWGYVREENKRSQERRQVRDNGSRQQWDCFVPIGDEDFGFKGNAIVGEHVKQVVTGKS